MDLHSAKDHLHENTLSGNVLSGAKVSVDFSNAQFGSTLSAMSGGLPLAGASTSATYPSQPVPDDIQICAPILGIGQETDTFVGSFLVSEDLFPGTCNISSPDIDNSMV